VPSLVVENKSAETIDYLQVELVLALPTVRNARSSFNRLSRGRAPSDRARRQGVLKQHLDRSRALGVPCGEVKLRQGRPRPLRGGGGKACASSVLVQPMIKRRNDPRWNGPLGAAGASLLAAPALAQPYPNKTAQDGRALPAGRRHRWAGPHDRGAAE